MKKIVRLIICCLFLMILGGCGNKVEPLTYVKENITGTWEAVYKNPTKGNVATHRIAFDYDNKVYVYTSENVKTDGTTNSSISAGSFEIVEYDKSIYSEKKTVYILCYTEVGEGGSFQHPDDSKGMVLNGNLYMFNMKDKTITNGSSLDFTKISD